MKAVPQYNYYTMINCQGYVAQPATSTRLSKFDCINMYMLQRGASF